MEAVGAFLALSVANVTLTSKRCYKEAYNHEESVGIIVGDKGKHFEPDLVEAFVRLKDDFFEIRKRWVDTKKFLPK